MNGFKFEAWPTEFRVINQLFGVNRDFYARFGLPGHEGLDVKADLGSRLFSVAPGQVKVVHTDPNTHNYGIHVRISHADGYETIYGHMQQALVQTNQNVAAGTLLGIAGSTGNSTGPHLHLTLKKTGVSQGGFPSNIIDPTPFLFPLLGWQEPAGPFTDGWAFTDALFRFSGLAQATNGGVSLRLAPATNATRVAVIPEGSIIIINGAQSNQYTPVRVPNAAIGLAPPAPPAPPVPLPPAAVTTVEGWGFAANIIVSGSQGVIGQFGINLRDAPERNATNIGLVNADSMTEVLGSVRGEYLPIRVRISDFMGPVNLPAAPPVIPTGPAPTPANSVLGWASTAFLTIVGNTATVTSQFGVNLRSAPAMNGAVLGVLKGSATVAGLASSNFTPLLANRSNILNLLANLPAVTQPTPLPGTNPADPQPVPIHDTTPGWAFTAAITVAGTEATAGQFGINLREEPRRNAVIKGFVPGSSIMIVTGAAQGEYTPVRVDDAIIQLTSSPNTPAPPPNVDPPVIGQARIGLHASADPGDLREAEFHEYAAMRPGIIKVLSSHSAASIARLASEHPTATWIVRAFLTFRGGRVVTPQQFFNDTIGDVERTLNQLAGKDVVIELHNEPNLSDEGLGFSWNDGAQFSAWWSELLNLYRSRLPGRRFIYPGLSPGSGIQMPGFRKDDHIGFIEASRPSVTAADGLGVHLYWARDYAMSRSLAVLDDYISRFQNVPIWVTEASNNKGGVSPEDKGRQYLRFWTELRQRPNVQGVTYFVASATDPTFAEEVWVGRGIGAVIGLR